MVTVAGCRADLAVRLGPACLKETGPRQSARLRCYTSGKRHAVDINMRAGLVSRCASVHGAKNCTSIRTNGVNHSPDAFVGNEFRTLIQECNGSQEGTRQRMAFVRSFDALLP